MSPTIDRINVFYRIADLLVDVPEAGGLAPRIRPYLSEENKTWNIRIEEEKYRRDAWPFLTEEEMVYIESGVQFYIGLLHFQGMMLHASSVAYEGRAYLFSAPCGTGKSTHAGLWQQVFGDSAQRFNDDKPALRRRQGKWFAYGTPWCGKDGINLNQKWSLGGICFLEQGPENSIRRLTPAESIGRFLSQTLKKLRPEEMELLLKHLDLLLREIPVFLLVCRPDEAAVRLSYETMRRAAEEAGL